MKENPFVGVVGLMNGFIGVVGSLAQCDRRGASGFVGDLVRADSRMMARRSRRWCDDLSTLSSFSLCFSLCAWFGNGETISMIGDWVRRGGFERSEWCDHLAPMRSSCSFSLSLFYFSRSEII